MKTKQKNWTKKVEEVYERNLDRWVRDISKEPRKYYYTTYFKALFGNGISGDMAIDIGCGAGTFTFELCKLNFKNIIALDISKGMLMALNKERKKRRVRKVHLVRSYAEKLPFKDDSFDFIVLVGVMECLQNQKNALAEIHRILKPGGFASVRWLNDEGLWGKLESMKRALMMPSGPFSGNFSNVNEVMQLLRKVGFKELEIRGAIILPMFIFPFPISTIFETLFVRTKLAYKLEGIKNNEQNAIRNWYYSFFTIAKK